MRLIKNTLTQHIITKDAVAIFSKALHVNSNQGFVEGTFKKPMIESWNAINPKKDAISKTQIVEPTTRRHPRTKTQSTINVINGTITLSHSAEQVTTV